MGVESQIKALTENPQDRTAVCRKIFETYGGKCDNYFMIPGGNENRYTRLILPFVILHRYKTTIT